MQNSQQYSWELEEVNRDLEQRLTDSIDEMLVAYEERNIPTLRTTAYTIALERAADAHEYRSLFP